jgi:hypothetical protein
MKSRKLARDAARRATAPLFGAEEDASQRGEIAAARHSDRIFSGAPRDIRWSARWLAGIDEAGLGPLLGPLAIGFSALRVPSERTDAWQSLRAICTQRVDDDADRLVVADSKVVFTRDARGERRLERTALTFLAQRVAQKRCATTARGVLDSLGADLRDGPMTRAAEGRLESGAEEAALGCGQDAEPWSRHLERAVPAHATPAEMDALAAALASELARAGIELASAGSRLVHVRDLNASFARTQNKSATHWQATRVLLLRLWLAHAHEDLDLTVDRHGGRVYYADLLAETFDGCSIHVVDERPEASEYFVLERAAPVSCTRAVSPESTDSCTAPGSDGASLSYGSPGSSAAPGSRAGTERTPRRMRVVFAERAESLSFCVALSSCLAKYARETCMNAFNEYFGSLQPGLRPTAGYTTDGWRWLAEAEPAIARSGVALEHLVRRR